MILLVRHASCEGMRSRLNGRQDGVNLSPAGLVEADRLARRLMHFSPRGVMTSPRERCLQTAQRIACMAKAPIEIEEDADEVDFGLWTGRDFSHLAEDSSWREWNQRRSAAQAPGGERMADVQRRMERALATAAARAATGAVVLVSHAEPIRAALAGILGFSLDAWSRLDISPAGVSRLVSDPPTLRICCINETDY